MAEVPSIDDIADAALRATLRAGATPVWTHIEARCHIPRMVSFRSRGVANSSVTKPPAFLMRKSIVCDDTPQQWLMCCSSNTWRTIQQSAESYGRRFRIDPG
jgi:hypothetical protein